MPQIFHRINIRAFKGNSPPVDILLKEGVSNSRNMLGIMKRFRVPSKMLQQRFASVTPSSVPRRRSFSQFCLLMQAQTQSSSRCFDFLLASSPTFDVNSGGTDGERLTFDVNENVPRVLSVYYSPHEFTSFGLIYDAKQLAILRVLKSPPLFFT